MTHDIDVTPWELRVQWSRSAEEFEYLQQRIEFPFVIRDGFTHLPIKGFEWSHDPGSVQKAAEEQLRCLNGQMVLGGIDGSFSPFGLHRHEPSGRSTQYIFAEGHCRVGICAWMSGECYDQGGNLISQADPPPKPIMDGLENDPQVREVLGFLSELQQDDWGILYKIVELIIASGAPLKDWGMESALDKVKAVANNPIALGRRARHAVQKGSPAKARLTFDRAREIVFSAVRQWRAHRRASAGEVPPPSL